jgi:hypothetical protein
MYNQSFEKLLSASTTATAYLIGHHLQDVDHQQGGGAVGAL